MYLFAHGIKKDDKQQIVSEAGMFRKDFNLAEEPAPC